MALSLDGSNFGSNGSASQLIVSLTTSAGSGVIVMCCVENDGPLTSVTAPSLTFALLTNPQNSTNAGQFVEIWTAPYTSNFSGNITINSTGAAFFTAVVFGIGGAATSSYFDSNGSLPLANPNPAAEIGPASTSNAKDFIFGCALGSGSNSVDATNWLPIQAGANADFFLCGYQIVSVTKTGIVFGDNNSPTTPQFGAIGAVIAASGATGINIWSYKT